MGYARLKALGQEIGEEVDPQRVWFRSLDAAKDVHEENAVKRAFREWADGDSVASHIAYGIDVFCTGDEGKSNADKSILDAQNREWLEEKYDVRFMTVRELLSHLQSAGLV
ncbi:hypothetical protein [Iodidimonas gelatinilytica]|uniref:hypothetical protein n=1 Tax=Iodidimonas gelatinilytica TaxID=1236966 RepID=UPI0012309E1E|nr:hypothetical protein [Iodidimonas gelatinilytica]